MTENDFNLCCSWTENHFPARRDVISRYVREILDAKFSVPRKFRGPPTFALCKGAPSFFSSMNDDVWMLALGTGGSVKGSIVAPSPGERTHSAPQGRPSWNITAKQQTAFCRLYTVNFMPDFLPTPSTPSPPSSPCILCSHPLMLLHDEFAIQSADNNK